MRGGSATDKKESWRRREAREEMRMRMQHPGQSVANQEKQVSSRLRKMESPRKFLIARYCYIQVVFFSLILFHFNEFTNNSSLLTGRL